RRWRIILILSNMAIDTSCIIWERNRKTPKRAIGYAVSHSVFGHWKRREEAIPLVADCNNPAACILEDGRTYLAYRCGQGMYIGLATAVSVDGEYSIVNPDIAPGKVLEDPYLFFNNGKFEMIVSDIEGSISGHKRFGGHLTSRDGITDWVAMNPD